MKKIGLQAGTAAFFAAAAAFHCAAGSLPAAAGGVITVEGEVTVADSAGAAALAAASSIVLTEGAALVYAASDALVLNASVSGSGSFTARNSGPVTLAGDNSGLVDPGSFSFTGTSVRVTHRFGLGSSRTATARFDGHPHPVTFDDGTDAFTNNVPLYLRSSSHTAVIGSVSLDKTFVQNASFFYNTATYSNGGRTILFTNNFEMIAGTFKLDNSSANGTYVKKAVSGGTVVFGGSTRLENTAYAYGMIVYANGCRFEAEYLDVRNGIATDSHRGIVFGRAGMLSAGTYLRPYAQQEVSKFTGSNYFDFDGCDQTIAYLGYANKNAARFASIGSEKPCELTTVSPAAGKEAADAPYFFTGALSYRHDTVKTNVFRALSPSTGSLTVTKGQVVFGEGELNAADGGGWSGRTVTVSGAGSLRCANPNALRSGKHDLTVESGGELVVDAGVEIAVGTARFGGVSLANYTRYTVAELQTLLAGEDVRVSGGGAVLVSAGSVTGEWKGWPDAGTAASVSVPDGTTVEITDDDVEKVAALTSIVGGQSSRIVCRTSAKTLCLNAGLSGACEFEAKGCGTVVLNGDSSDLWNPGGFIFSNTVVVVSNMYGLGGTKTAAARFYPAMPFENTSRDRIDLSFGGPAISNFVAIVMDRCYLIGHQDPSVVFAHCNDFVHLNGGVGVGQRGYFRNNFRFERGSMSLPALAPLTGSRVTIGADCTVSGVEGFFNGGEVHLESRHFDFNMLRIEQCVKRVRFYDAYCLDSNKELYYYDGSAPDLVVDLNGFDQRVGRLHGVQYDDPALKYPPNALSVSSSVPASVHVCGAAMTGIAAKFIDQAGMTYCGTSTQKLGIVKSPTLAPLVVESGTVLFERGGGWLGTNVTVEAGSLVVRASAATNTFGIGRATRTDLVVSAGAAVELESAAYTSTVRSVTYDGKLLKRGVYSAANCGFITGRGALRAVDGLPDSLFIFVR